MRGAEFEHTHCHIILRLTFIEMDGQRFNPMDNLNSHHLRIIPVSVMKKSPALFQLYESKRISAGRLGSLRMYLHAVVDWCGV